jgi:hypothetical protein
MESDLVIRSRQSLSGPQIFFLTFDFTQAIGGNIWDVPFALPFPCNTFFISSVKGGDEINSLILYFKALGYPLNFPFTTLKGNEQIYYLNSVLTTGPVYRTVLRFKDPVLNFFLAIGTENGHASRYTIGCTNDDELELTGGIYT